AESAVPAVMHGSDDHPLPLAEAGDVIADVDNLAGDVAAGDVRKLDAGKALADPEVEVIQGAGANPYENLVMAVVRVGHVLVLQHSGAAEFVEANGFHDLLR